MEFNDWNQSIIMKSIFKTFCFLLTLTAGCTKDAEITLQDYPLVVTSISQVSGEGAIVHAEVLNPGKFKILSFGFVWGRNQMPDLSDNSKIFENGLMNQEFTYTINNALIKNELYFVRSYIKTDRYEVYGNEINFESKGSLSPEIDNFAPVNGAVGTRVVIHGENFATSLNGNVVKFGSRVAVIDSATENTIYVQVPEFPVPEFEMVNISVITAGDTTTSKDLFHLLLPWIKKGNNDIYIGPYNSASFTLNGKGYFFSEGSLVEFDPEKNSITKLVSLPENSNFFILATSSATNGYLLINQNLYMFDPVTISFSFIANFPYPRAHRDYIFNLNNEIYVGSGCDDGGSDGYLYKYDAIKNLWIEKKASANLTYSNYVTYYSYKNEGYVLHDNNNVGVFMDKYDPVNNTWTTLTTNPLKLSYGFCHFFIDDKIYTSPGFNENWHFENISNHVWQYDILNNEWKEMHDRPKNISTVMSLSINGKGYIFCRRDQESNFASELWEFDPEIE
jgi:hypothetical protein